MSFIRPVESAETADSEVGSEQKIRTIAAVPHQSETDDSEMTASSLSALLRRVSGVSTREIDNLIGELQALREKLCADGNRIQRDIEDYAAVSQQAMQLTKIICESVRKLPDATRIAG